MARQQIKTLDSIAGLPLEKQLKAIKLLVDGGLMSRRARRAARRILAGIQSNEAATPELRERASELRGQIPQPEVSKKQSAPTSAANERTPKVVHQVTRTMTDPLEELREAMEFEARQTLVPPSGPVKPWVGTPPRQTTLAHCEKCGEPAECVFSVGWRCQDCWGQITSSSSSKNSQLRRNDYEEV